MDDGHIDDSPTDDASSHHIISTYLRTDRDVTIPRIVKNWAVMSEVEDAQVMQLEADKIVATLAQLWKARSLVDTVLVTGGGETHHAHALMLCASSGYCRAALLGAGASMHGRTAGNSSDTHAGCTVLHLPDVDAQDMEQVLSAMYERRVVVGPHNLERLLSVASYLQVPLLLDACATFMRSVLSLHTCVPLLLLASRYDCTDLRQYLLSYICARFSSLASPAPPTPSPAPTAPPAASPGTSPQPLLHMSQVPGLLSTGHVRTIAEAAGGTYAASLSPPGSLGAANSSGPGSISALPGMPQACTTTSSSYHGDSSHKDQANSSETGTTSTSPLSLLSKDVLLELLRSDELAVDCETDVVAAVVDWVASDAESRMSDLGELLSAVRVEQLPAALPALHTVNSPDTGPLAAAQAAVFQAAGTILAHMRERLAMGGTPPPGGAQLTSSPGPLGRRGSGAASPSLPPVPQRRTPPPQMASAHHRQGGITPAGPSVLSSPATATASAPPHASAAKHVARAFSRVRRHLPTGLLAAGGHDASWRSLKVVERYDPTADAWAPLPFMSHSLSFAGAVVLDKDVYVVGGTPLWNAVLRLGPDSTAWEQLPGLVAPRAHAGIVSANGSLFVLGGRSQRQAVQHVLPSVEVFSPERYTWGRAPDMALPRSALGSAVLGGGVYAIGGQSQKRTLRSVERFDVGEERWVSLGSELNRAVKYGAAAVVGGRVYVVGGVSEARTRMASVMALDPREGLWRDVAPMSVPRSSCGVAALQVGAHGRLFAVGGMDAQEGVHGLVEAYHPEMNVWLSVASLGTPRSGLGVCAV